jgi:hypothetical protein
VKGGFDRNRWLQELEQHDWGEPNYQSNLVQTVHRLRRKPLDEFTVEDLRIVIGQKISLSYLVLLAVECLEKEPLVSGDFYPGDLLAAVLSAGDEFWASHADSYQRTCKIVGRVKGLRPSLGESERPLVVKTLAEAPRSLTE